MSAGERLVIGPSDNHLDMMVALAGTWSTQEFYVLYVLLISHTGSQPGRYQSPLFESFEDLQMFLYSYEQFLQTDGRHHLWIGSPTNDGLLIYDQHDVIFAYGDLSRYESVVKGQSFSERDFWFPVPHGHNYPATNAKPEEELLRHFDWRYSPLKEGDEW